MPGKSKKGGGLESSPVYKKQRYGEAKSPFTMKGSSFLNKDKKKDNLVYTKTNTQKVQPGSRAAEQGYTKVVTFTTQHGETKTTYS